MTPTRRRLALAAFVVAASTALSGCGMLQQFIPTSQPVRDAGTGKRMPDG